jgi:hypothetical protein
MAQLSEKEIPFELIEALLNYFRSLNTPGAVLIFLPGWNSIFALLRHLSGHNVFGKGRQTKSLSNWNGPGYVTKFYLTTITRFKPVSALALPLPNPPRGPEEGLSTSATRGH